ncbi:carboxymuconolactone decarboxylase family protein [Falsiroseomonas sp.]|uniref:carboxymuconolactone decarboxylase family protein n=1 Tax=Falsiroseomonas sp. TaxID=2870721 RepID=UPI00356AD2D9
MAPRIPLPGRDELDEAQRTVWDSVVSGPRGQVIGPLRAAIHNAELARRWSALGEALRFNTSLPKRLSELAIAATGRRWSSQVEWWVHARAAAENGIAPAILDAIREGRPPAFDAADEALVYDFVRDLQHDGGVREDTYRAAVEAFGVKGVVELTALVGYYTMVSMTLNAHGVPLPDGAVEPLQAPPEGLFALPPRDAP